MVVRGALVLVNRPDAGDDDSLGLLEGADASVHRRRLLPWRAHGGEEVMDYKEKAAELLNALDALKDEKGRFIEGTPFPSQIAEAALRSAAADAYEDAAKFTVSLSTELECLRKADSLRAGEGR